MTQQTSFPRHRWTRSILPTLKSRLEQKHRPYPSECHRLRYNYHLNCARHVTA